MVGVNALSEGVGLVDLDAPVEVVMPQVNAMRVYVGYAGWTAGQLVGEIDEGAWQVVDADPDDPFWPDTSQMWRAVLARQRNPVSWLTTYTAHPDHN
jgi:putative transcriptional regulator